MYSVIFSYIDNEWNENLSIGSYWYYNKVISSCRQLIEVIAIKQTQEQWDYMTSLSQQELYNALVSFMKKNELKVIRPN